MTLEWLAYNTRIVLMGTLLLGMCGGGVGCFMLLRKKALVGDVASHAALPGIGVAYLIVEAVHPGGGKSLPWLLVGASISAVLGVIAANLIQHTRLIKEDAALGIVLSLFFGTGVVLFTVVQETSGQAAGLDAFIFGKTAGMTQGDVLAIAAASSIVLVICWLMFKEFTILCFDEAYATTVGWPVRRLDLLLTTLVVGVTVIGMQSVGLLLVVALLVIPPTAARFWSDRLGPMVLMATAIGGLSASVGVLLSASVKNLAAGPTIVLMGSLAFAFSLLFGSARGTVWELLQHRRAARRKGQLDLLRACYEEIERQCPSQDLVGPRTTQATLDLTSRPISMESLIHARSWSASRVLTLLKSAIVEGWLRYDSDGKYRLTQTGSLLATRAARNHRLWELYLIHFADVAPGRVDREADLIEHVLEPELIAQLEDLLRRKSLTEIPVSPHV